MSINQQLKNEIYLAQKKNPYIKRSLLAKEFGVSHKTVTKAINDTRILDIDALAKMGIRFHTELLKFQDQYREDITNKVIQSNSYKKSKQDSSEFQEFMEERFIKFKHQTPIFMKEALSDYRKTEKIKYKNNKAERDFDKAAIPLFKKFPHLGGILTMKQLIDSSMEVFTKRLDNYIEEKRLEIERAALKEWKALKEPKNT